ncbi:LysR substrate-binding domain-containing protein [Variibacter gotjawalensis]
MFLFAARGEGKSFYEHLFPGKEQVGFVAMRTNTSAAYAWTIAKGAGVGWLPTYARACGARVVPLDLDMRLKLGIWLVHHPSASRVARVRHTIEWIADRCGPKRYPWLRGEFIHPNDFDDRYTGPPLLNLFEGFVGFGTESNEPREWGARV